jgi:phenylpropionate dioxygenase-like ring-hydroxylating dioxygenase large terminal subunit
MRSLDDHGVPTLMTATPAPAIPERKPLVASADLRRIGSHPDYWYPLARSKQIKRGKAIGVSFAGEPIALVRTESGRVFAVEDRCAHRQVPLHTGVVEGERLRCGYHGWTYDGGGRCVTIPYLDRARTVPNGVRAYPCREAYGLVFVFPGDAGKAESTPFPDIPTHADSRYKTRSLDRRVACHYSFMHENLMDMNHQFLHRTLMGKISTIFLGMERTENRVEADYTFSRKRGRQPIGERFIIGGTSHAKGDDAAPDAKPRRDLMTITTDYPYQTLRFWTAGSEEPALDLWNCYVPVDKSQRVNHTHGLMMIRRPRIPGLIHLLWPFIVRFTEGIFAEDRLIVEEEQRAFDAQGADWNQEVFPVIRELKQLLAEKGVPLPDEAR